jgi:multidrug efflux system membrane fusion protein
MNFQNLPQTEQVSRPPSVSPERSRRVTMIVGLAVVGVLALLFAYNLIREHMVKSYLAANKPPPVSVTYEIVAASTMPQFLTAVGSITAVHQVTVSPEVDGAVTRILFQAGATVKKGDLLVQLNDAPEQADLNAMHAQQRLAQTALDRQRRLIESGFVAQAQLDQAQSQHDAAAANTARLQALIAQKQIRAPFDGVLGVREVEVGQYLKAGADVTSITQPSPLYVNFTLPEQAQPRVGIGQDVTFTVDAHGERTFTARVAVIDPQVTAETRTVKVQALAENPDGVLASGMFANVNLVMPPRTGALTVPETAIDYTVGGAFVYVIQEETNPDTKATALKVHRIAIEAGERQGNRVAVTGGLNAGDRIVSAGQIRLFEGATVVLGDHAPPPGPSLNSLN